MQWNKIAIALCAVVTMPLTQGAFAQSLETRVQNLERRVDALEGVIPPSAIFPQGDASSPILQIGLRQHKDWAGPSPYKSLHVLAVTTNLFALTEAGKYDPATGWFTLAPNERITLGRLRNSQTKGFDLDPGVWCVVTEREGTAYVRAGNLKDEGSTPSRHRICADITGLTSGWQVILDGGSSGGRARVVFWGPQIYEDDPDGWHPEWLAQHSRYHILRGMDYFLPANAKIVKASQWVRDDDYTYYAESSGWDTIPNANDNLIRGGYSFARFFDLANKADAAAWINLPVSLGAESFRAELVECDSASNDLNLGEENQAIRAALILNFDTFKTAAKVEWRAIADKVIDGLEKVDYPTNRVLLIEPMNEAWNTGTPHFACQHRFTAAIGAALTGSDDLGRGQGYITALAVEAIRERFNVRRPNQSVQFVTGWHTGAADGVGGFRALNFIAGFQSYKADYHDDLLQVFAGTTGYWAGGFKWNPNRSAGAGNPFLVSTEVEFNAAFEAAHRADPVSMQRLIRDWHLGPVAHDNVKSLVRNNLILRDIAIAGGMRGSIQYEGGPHENALERTGQLGSVYPGSLNAWLEFSKSRYGRDVQAAAIAELSAIDPINPMVTTGWAPRTLVISNYNDVGLEMTARQPWLERDANQLTVCNDNSIAGAWCAAGRKSLRR